MQEVVKGVNLGGWLVLEKWITPSLFKGVDVPDEYGLCQKGGADAKKRLKQHRQTFITRQDFVWLKQQGITAVRIPVGYWAFGDVKPYLGTIKYLDKAFKWAEDVGLDVLICLHGAPGSQNGEMHSGRQGTVGWDKDMTHVDQTLDIIGRLAMRYKDSPRLWGIELLNEPAATVSKRLLKRYYHQAYYAIRQICGPQVRIIVNDIWRPKCWRWPVHWPKYKNVWFDTHQYQIFTDRERAMDVAKHIKYTQTAVRSLLRTLRRHHHLIVGEWSAALDPRSLAGLDQAAVVKACRQYFDVQQAVYDQTDGWFYWTYKVESQRSLTVPHPWSFREMHAADTP